MYGDFIAFNDFTLKEESLKIKYLFQELRKMVMGQTQGK